MEENRGTQLILILIILFGLLIVTAQNARAENPDRQTKIVVKYTEYEWWLMRWEDNQIMCRILIDHDGLPASDEVYTSCGTDLQAEWLSTPPCAKLLEGNGKATSCPGFYLHKIAFQPKEREIVVNLPPIEAWVDLEGCSPLPPENLCTQLPKLLLTAEEPLPNEEIVAIEGFLGNIPFACEGSTCALPLRITPEEGVPVEFQARSSFGDTSKIYKAKVRVIDSGVSQVPGGAGWHVDVISLQWRGAPLASCSQSWAAFPPIGGMNNWLATPNTSKLLSSSQPYYYLAGRLIAQGIVDGSSCPAGGLLANGYADSCGLEVARQKIETWQNQFDERIIQVARESGVPAMLMKNLFAQESQFWPGVFRVPYEYGLGQITDHGADAILQWNPSFYNQFCPLVLAQETCTRGYLHLTEDEQAMLRGAYAVQAQADCPGCSQGLDISNVQFSVSLFADTLLANCEQVAQIVYNATGEIAGTVSSYEDLWRMTVANYHAGPGCLSYAAHMAWLGNRVELLWDEMATLFTEPCQGVIPYVEKIAP